MPLSTALVQDVIPRSLWAASSLLALGGVLLRTHFGAGAQIVIAGARLTFTEALSSV